MTKKITNRKRDNNRFSPPKLDASVVDVANYFEIALPIAMRIKTQKGVADQVNQFVGDSVAFKFITFRSNGVLWRMLCLEEGCDGSFYVWHLPKNSGRKITFHSNRGRGVPPYQRHHHGAGYHRIPESINSTQKFITEYKESPFCEYHWTGRGVHGVVVEKAGFDDIVFDLNKLDFNQYELALFSDHRSDLVQSHCINAEGKMAALKTLKIVASVLYRKS